MYTALATLAIAMFRNFMAKGVSPQMGDLAQERNRRLGVAILELAIRRAHAAEGLNLAAVANHRASARLVANLTQRPLPTFEKTAFANVVTLLMRDDADAHRAVGIDGATTDAASAEISLSRALA